MAKEYKTIDLSNLNKALDEKGVVLPDQNTAQEKKSDVQKENPKKDKWHDLQHIPTFQTIYKILSTKQRAENKQMGQPWDTGKEELKKAAWYIFYQKHPDKAEQFNKDLEPISLDSLNENARKLTKDYLDGTILKKRIKKDSSLADGKSNSVGSEEKKPGAGIKKPIEIPVVSEVTDSQELKAQEECREILAEISEKWNISKYTAEEYGDFAERFHLKLLDDRIRIICGRKEYKPESFVEYLKVLMPLQDEINTVIRSAQQTKKTLEKERAKKDIPVEVSDKSKDPVSEKYDALPEKFKKKVDGGSREESIETLTEIKSTLQSVVNYLYSDSIISEVKKDKNFNGKVYCELAGKKVNILSKLSDIKITGAKLRGLENQKKTLAELKQFYTDLNLLSTKMGEEKKANPEKTWKDIAVENGLKMLSEKEPKKGDKNTDASDYKGSTVSKEKEAKEEKLTDEEMEFVKIYQEATVEAVKAIRDVDYEKYGYESEDIEPQIQIYIRKYFKNLKQEMKKIIKDEKKIDLAIKKIKEQTEKNGN